jgi:hypothetical protein
LQSIPILNRVLSGTTKEKSQTEILFSITPHLVRAPKIGEDDLRSVFIGTQEVLRVGTADSLFGAPDPVPSPVAESPAPPPGPSIGRPPGTVSPSMPDLDDVQTPAATPPPPRVVPTPLPPPDVLPGVPTTLSTPPPGPPVPEPTPPGPPEPSPAPPQGPATIGAGAGSASFSPSDVRSGWARRRRWGSWPWECRT